MVGSNTVAQTSCAPPRPLNHMPGIKTYSDEYQLCRVIDFSVLGGVQAEIRIARVLGPVSSHLQLLHLFSMK